jgi:flagellar assembly factor FliW
MDVMKVQSSRFGTIELDDHEVIRFPAGLIGFPDETSFVMLRPKPESPIAWLHSTQTSWFALPVVSAEALQTDIGGTISEATKAAGLVSSDEHLAVMAVLNAPGGGAPASVNLMAPIIVNAETRQGAQLLLESSNYSTQEPFVLRTVEARPNP